MKLYCESCTCPRQAYFGGRMALPCFFCEPRSIAFADFNPAWYGIETEWRWRLAFMRDLSSDLWRSVPNIDPSSMPTMIDVFKAEGLGGCFVKPPHLHDHHVLGEGETIAEKCPTGGCTWSVAQAPHRCGVMCYAGGCKLGGIDPHPPRGLNPDRRLLASGLAIEAAEAEHDRRAAVDAARTQRVSDAARDALADAFVPDSAAHPIDNSTWDFAPDPKTHRTAGDVRSSISVGPWPPESIPVSFPVVPPGPAYYLGAPSGFMATSATAADVRGIMARDATPDAVAGCRLGCACPEHKPPREPWVPSVDDLHWVKDA